jgi:DNA-directed RNA polymerase specialized sigma24 family protein
MVDDDARLLLAARSGDPASLGLLLESYRPRLLAVAMRLLGDYGGAEDAVQETFVIACDASAASATPPRSAVGCTR